MRPPLDFKSQLTPVFSSEWCQFFDELVPDWVKTRYSPKDSWKGKPFADPDCRFFFKGLEELSDQFTVDRPSKGRTGKAEKIPAYFRHPRFRSAYLLYFFPLQAAKFNTAFQFHPQALDRLLQSSKTKEKDSPLEIFDLGAGPGTASFALIFELLKRAPLDFPLIRFTWVDQNREIMEDGKALMKLLMEKMPTLKDRILVDWLQGDWLPDAAPKGRTPDLILLGNLLNEFTGHELNSDRVWMKFKGLLQAPRSAGVLMIEPAARLPSQRLSYLRDRALEENVFERRSESLWGPCLHAGACPLGQGRDWCHFSVPAKIPGKWFKAFSKLLGSEREWLKFSYIWFAAVDFPSDSKPKQTELVISDPIPHPSGGRAVLICQPNQPDRLKIPERFRAHRGDHLRR